MRKKLFKQALVTIFLLCILIHASATTVKKLWPKWEAHNPLSEKTIAHKEWQTFLDKRIITNDEGINLVDYPNLNEEDKRLIESYLRRLSKIDIDDYNRNEQLAYWLNLYNALTVKIIADYYPLNSIRDIKASPGIFNMGPWSISLITIDQSDLSLEDIHNRIIRPIWNDPRTHYAINNASIGAANLGKQAFSGTRLNEQLNQAATTYINSLRGAQVIDEQLIASKIYDWFIEDFGGDTESILNHMQQYAFEPLKTKLTQIKCIEGYTYNWHLNAPYHQAMLGNKP